MAETHPTSTASMQGGQGQSPQQSEAAAKQAQEAHKAHVEALKKKDKEDKEVREKLQREQRDKIAHSKPTPTQDENDRAKLGEHIEKHEDDGSGPDPTDPIAVEKAKQHHR